MASYSSKYYDPVKAHEYYEEHKQLKGRKASTASLNETGKNAASYVKQQVDKEKQETLKAESKRFDIQVYTETKEAEEKIANLRKKFSRLTPAQKKILGPKILRELQKIKRSNDKKRRELQNAYSKNVENINNKYSDIYNEEVEKMNADSSLIKESKTATKTSTKKSATKTSTTKKDTSKSKTKSVEQQIAEKREEAKKLMAQKKNKKK